MKGQHVKLKRQTGASVFQSNWMNICEVQVYGYLYYGELPFCARYTMGTTRVDGDPVPYPLRMFVVWAPVSRQYSAISMKQ